MGVESMMSVEIFNAISSGLATLAALIFSGVAIACIIEGPRRGIKIIGWAMLGVVMALVFL